MRVLEPDEYQPWSPSDPRQYAYRVRFEVISNRTREQPNWNDIQTALRSRDYANQGVIKAKSSADFRDLQRICALRGKSFVASGRVRLEYRKPAVVTKVAGRVEILVASWLQRAAAAHTSARQGRAQPADPFVI